MLRLWKKSSVEAVSKVPTMPKKTIPLTFQNDSTYVQVSIYIQKRGINIWG
jgi:hypothetical protein